MEGKNLLVESEGAKVVKLDDYNMPPCIIKKADAKRVDIDLDMLEKAYKNNMFKNTINWGTGFAISALFLSTIIPKVQYWITRKTTGSNEFPGVANYDK